MRWNSKTGTACLWIIQTKPKGGETYANAICNQGNRKYPATDMWLSVRTYVLLNSGAVRCRTMEEQARAEKKGEAGERTSQKGNGEKETGTNPGIWKSIQTAAGKGKTDQERSRERKGMPGYEGEIH